MGLISKKDSFLGPTVDSEKHWVHHAPTSYFAYKANLHSNCFVDAKKGDAKTFFVYPSMWRLWIPLREVCACVLGLHMRTLPISDECRRRCLLELPVKDVKGQWCRTVRQNEIA